MGLASINLAGADTTTNNRSGDDYVAAVQLTTARTKVFSLVGMVRTAVGADRVFYLFDTAAGIALETPDETCTTDPKVPPLTVGYGLTGALDLGSGGMVFTNGVYLVVATDEVADAVTAPSAASANDAIVTVALKVY